ncbi:MAG: hypothetical protein JOY77_01205 [Alphaproteobacteria bacterium]|nr:hypothetical protein [Alphaproteobacteria bacterium]
MLQILLVRRGRLNERAAFREMLEIEFRDRELSDDEKRRGAKRIWRKFIKYGWPLQSNF